MAWISPLLPTGELAKKWSGAESPLGSSSSESKAHPFKPEQLSATELRLGVGFIEALIPGGGDVPRADERSLFALMDMLNDAHPLLPHVWWHSVRFLNSLATVQMGRPFLALSHAEQEALLRKWMESTWIAPLLQGLSFAVKFAHFDRREVYERLGGRLNVVRQLEAVRWAKQIVDASRDGCDTEIECEVVVVGTGAGGAVVGCELAERGHAVVFVEEGRWVRRNEFTGSSIHAHKHFYRGCVAFGNNAFPIFIGRLVGGSTAINGGTCFRTPEWVLERWCKEMQTEEFSPTAMEPYFLRVESRIDVQAADPRYIGKIREIFARGCDALGWSHFSIRRNAPGCDGSGFCDFGCRTDARKSTNITYIPFALEKGALLITRLKAERVILDGERAVGIEASAPNGRKHTIRANVVVLSGGAIPTPLLLLKQGIANSSNQVGCNITLHPSLGFSAIFDDLVLGKDAIPQGYGCDQFLKDGVLLMAAQPDINYAPLVTPLVGDRLVEFMNALPHVASFGVLIADHGRGKIVGETDGIAFVRYFLSHEDVAKAHDGLVRMGEMCWAAGAKRVLPAVLGCAEYGSKSEWERDFVGRRLSPSQLLITSYHPLGSCRMGRDPKASVVDINHETHDIKNLFIVDGSTVNGPLGVNPQLTIMAMATRAAEKIAERVAS
ncbi:MAG: GMC family oxidoreductase [Sandaracinaceae bacterium]|nr:GMC family oxidoreductase [Sandaracinaceae bacterium]